MQENLTQLSAPLLRAVADLQQADSGALADLISDLLLSGRDGARIRPSEVMDQVDANFAQADGEADAVSATVRLRLVAMYGGLRMDREDLDSALREGLGAMAVSVEEEETLDRLHPHVRVETIEVADQDD